MKNESGFSLAGVLLIVTAVGLISFAGWKVWQASPEPAQDTVSKSAPPAAKKAVKEDKSRVAPKGHILYENKEIGFSFYYPEYWGSLSPKAAPTSQLDLEGPSVPTSDEDEFKLTVWSDKIADFESRSNNRGLTYTPAADGDKYVWKYATSAYGFQAGDIAQTQPETLSGAKDTKIYKIKGGHACGGEMLYLFPAGDNFVGLMMDYSGCFGLRADGTSKEKMAQFESAYKQLEDEISKIPSSIEVGSN